MNRKKKFYVRALNFIRNSAFFSQISILRNWSVGFFLDITRPPPPQPLWPSVESNGTEKLYIYVKLSLLCFVILWRHTIRRPVIKVLIKLWNIFLCSHTHYWLLHRLWCFNIRLLCPNLSLFLSVSLPQQQKFSYTSSLPSVSLVGSTAIAVTKLRWLYTWNIWGLALYLVYIYYYYYYYYYALHSIASTSSE